MDFLRYIAEHPEEIVSQIVSTVYERNVYFLADVQGFIQAVDWHADRWWLLSLAALHVIVFLLAILSRKNFTMQMIIFFGICGAVYSAQYLNMLLQNNWKHFSTQNYFDDNGLFLSSLFSGPLLLISIVIVFNMFGHVLQTLAVVKRAYLRQRTREMTAEQYTKSQYYKTGEGNAAKSRTKKDQ